MKYKRSLGQPLMDPNPHFIGGATKAQGGQANRSMSHSKSVAIQLGLGVPQPIRTLTLFKNDANELIAFSRSNVPPTPTPGH